MGRIKIYGIPNCDVTQKTLAWMKEQQLDVEFHDYKTEPAVKSWLNECCEKLGWEKLLNKRSTTWRSLSPSEQSLVVDKNSAINLMVRNNSIIKRPVVLYKDKIMVGYDEKIFLKMLN